MVQGLRPRLGKAVATIAWVGFCGHRHLPGGVLQVEEEGGQTEEGGGGAMRQLVTRSTRFSG